MRRQLFLLNPRQSIHWCEELGIDLASLARTQRRRRYRRRAMALGVFGLALGALALLLIARYGLAG